MIMEVVVEKKYRLDSAFELLEKDEKYLYVDYKNGNWFRTNRIGMELLSMIDGSSAVDEVIGKFAELNGFPHPVIKKKIMPFLSRALERKLLLDQNEQHENVNTEFSEYPNDLWIHVTDLCNMHCPFCYSSSGSCGVKKLDMEKVLKFVSGIPYDKRKSIIISGGEPLLYPELPELVKELKALNFHITVISNGTVDYAKYDAIIPYINALQISIDGATEEIYQNTRGKGNYKKAVSTLDHAFEQGMQNIVVSFTTNKYNIDSIQDMAEFARIHHVNHLHITKIIPSGRANDIMDKIVPTANEYSIAISRLSQAVLAANQKIETMHHSEEMFLDEEQQTKFITMTVSSDPIRKTLQQTKVTTCSLGCGTLSIGYDGNIYPCGCLQASELQIGTLDDSIDEVMQRGHTLGHDHSVDNPEVVDCYACKYKYICGGGCRACASSAGNIKGKDPMCEFYIERIEKVMWDSPCTVL